MYIFKESHPEILLYYSAEMHIIDGSLFSFMLTKLNKSETSEHLEVRNSK